METTKMSMDRWIKKMWCMYLYNEKLLSYKRERENNAFYNNIYPLGQHYAK